MHGAARANTLHDLLADVTALVEVQRTILRRLLRQLALADVNAVARPAFRDAMQFERVIANGPRAGVNGRIPHRRRYFWVEPQFVSGDRGVGAYDGNPSVSRCCRALL